jgi:outer membrane scaffolding protein for murein synthesis (MipA/OmpV family)
MDLKKYSIISRLKYGLLVFGVLLSAPAAAYHLPKWELGLGVVALHMPAYRGASGKNTTWLPIPYAAYRSERIKMDEEGIRGKLLQKNRVRLDFSVAGSLPVSGGDGRRRGMPGLDPIGEIGPSLEFVLAQNGHRHNGWEQQWWLRLPLRAAMSVGDPLIAHQGWVFSPFLNWVLVRDVERTRWRWNLAVGPIYASRDYHDYFYMVDERFQTPTRSTYDASAGYSGSRVTLGLSVNSRHWFVGAFARYDDLHGAVFEDSPVVETGQFFAVGIAVSRIFMRSSERAPH